MDQIVSNGKEKNGEIKRSQNKTGGGPVCAPPNAQQEKVINLFSKTPSFSGIKGALESNTFLGNFMIVFAVCFFIKQAINTFPHLQN